MTQPIHKVSDVVREWEIYCLKNSVPPLHRISYADLQRRILTTLLSSIVERIEGEKLQDDTGEPEDVAYNQAIEDAITIIKSTME